MDEVGNSQSEGLSASEKGTSNTTLATLIVVVLLVTIIGTWAVLNSANSAQPRTINTGTVNSDSGKISLTIAPIRQLEQSQTTGLVSLNIIKA